MNLKNLVEERRQQFIAFNQLDSLTEIPSEMLFASASGLDPHVSSDNALLQAARIARIRNIPENSIVEKNFAVEENGVVSINDVRKISYDFEKNIFLEKIPA
jgi:K+-transporting ATPase c subunit